MVMASMRRLAPAIGVAAVVLSASGAQRVGAQVGDLQVFPAAVTIGVGQREEILVSAYSSSGDYLSSARFQWSRVDTAIVRVETDPASPPGVFYLVGVGPGSAELEVRAGGQSRTIGVPVTGAAIAAGVGVATILQLEPAEVRLFPLEQVQLQPTFLKDDGTLAAYSPLTWESVRPEVAKVDQGGVVAAMDPGVTVIEARTSTGLSRRVRVEVTPADWRFAQPQYSLAPLESDTLRAVVPSQGNRPLDPRQFTGWSSSNPNVVAVSPVGVVTAMSTGTAEVAATAFGQEQRVTVTVHPEVVEILVNPQRGEVLVPLGGSVSFTATAIAADSAPIPEAVLLWDIADSAVASFDRGTLAVSGRQIGTTRLTMRARGFPDATWDVEVVATGLVIDRQRFGMGRSDHMTLHAAFADSTGAPLGPARQVSWVSSAPGVVAVSADGELQPAGVGRAEIVASTPWGVADTTLVFVQGEILVTSTREGTADVFALDRASPEILVPVTNGPGDDLGAAYSPDGSRIAFASNRDGNFEIYVVDADGANPVRVTETDANETEPAWSPDGQRLVFQSDASGAPQIWIMNADGSGPQALTAGPANMEPAVSPDGAMIAFSSIRDGNYEIYLMDIDGENERNFTNTPTSIHERVPAWIDAGTLAYLREERTGRSATWVVVRHPLDGELETLTTPGPVVNDFAVSADADLLATAVEAPGPSGVTLRQLYLTSLSTAASVEVRRAGTRDQLVRPAFRH